MSDRILVDTCGWIEFAADGPLAETFAPYFHDLSLIVVPTVVQFEFFKWIKRERDEPFALELIGLTENACVVPLSTSIALLAADLASQHRLAMADAIIYATARQEDVLLASCDQHFSGLPGVRYVEKGANA